MIIVTGATGGYGQKVITGLLEKVPAHTLGVSVRDPQKASHLAERGVRVVKGDFAQPDTLAQAFEGAEQVLIVSVNAIGEGALRQHAAAIQAAKDAGAKRVLYTSHQAAHPFSAFVPARDHAATEALLQTSGLDFVSLRNGFYAESALHQLTGLQHGTALSLPADGPVSWTARDDLAEAAVAALTQPGLFDGFTPPLTHSQTLNFSDIAALASEVLQRPIAYQEVPDKSYRDGLCTHGLPQELANMLLTMFWASRIDQFNVTDPTLAQVLGRQPTPMQEVLRRFWQK